MRSCTLFPLMLLSLAASIACAQSEAPLPAPGLPLPHGAIPYALDHFEGQPQLVAIHHTTVELNNHKGANAAGALAGSFLYKPKMTVEVPGAHARAVLHDRTPVFYIHVLDDPEGGTDSPVFAIVEAVPDEDRRIFAQVRFTQLTGNANRKDGIVDSVTEHLPGGWLKLTPSAPLAPGEYALNPIPKAQNAYSTVVFDFAIDPAAPNAPDAIKPQSEP